MRDLPALCLVLLWTAELAVLSVAHNIRVEFSRSQGSPNNITLVCRNNFVTLEDADFWVNSTDQPLTSILSNYKKGMGKIEFLLHPDIEGSYFCGNIATKLESSNNWTLVAYPIQSQTFSDYYTAEVGSSITLSCPFARGALTQFHSFIWMKGFSTVVGNMQDTPRFSGNSTDFSLTIQSVTLSDISEYLCRVFVTNPIGNDWIVDSDPIRLCVYDARSTSMSVKNRCAVAPTQAVSSLPNSTTPAPSTVYATHTPPTMKPPSRSPLKFYGVVGIAISGVVSFSLCATGAIIAIFMVWKKKRPRHKLSRQREPDNAIELGQVNNISTNCEQRVQDNCEERVQANCEQGDQGSYQSSQDGDNDSLQVQVDDDNSAFESADDINSRGASPSDNLTGELQNREVLSGCEGPGCAVQLVGTMEQSQSEGHTLPPSEEIRDIPGSLPIGRSISETHQNSLHTPSGGRLLFGRQSRQDSGLAMLSPLSDIVTSSSAQSRSCPTRSSDVFILQSTEDYQVDSNELMFLGSVRVLMCDSRGGKFQIAEHDITLSFPQGAVPDTIQVEVEVGVAIHGLFDFLDDLRPISVLVWVHTKRPDFEFQKPVEISLPHYLKLSKNDARNSSNLGLGFMVTDGEEDDHHLIFKEGAKEQVSYKQTKAIISTTHFCYMCLSAKASVIAEKSLYLLTQVQPEPITSLRWQIHFCVSYNLCSFVEMIKQQYRSQGKVVSLKTFHFAPPPLGKKLELEISFQTPIKGWQIILPTYKTILQSDVELWEDDVSMLQNRVMREHFPPRVTVEVAGEGAFGNTTQLFSFEGANPRLESEVHLCLPAEHVAQHKNTLQYLESRYAIVSQLAPSLPLTTIASPQSCPGNMLSLLQHQLQAHPDEPTEQELAEVMTVIAGGMGPNWRTLIPVLGIPPDKEQEILQDNIGLKTQILKMLQMWRILHRTDGKSTRAHLAAILRKADPCLHSAVKILERPLTHSLQS